MRVFAIVLTLQQLISEYLCIMLASHFHVSTHCCIQRSSIIDC
jgi:hypothetical protein